MLARKTSRSRLIDSMVMEAITWRSCPKMMSSACFSISSLESPSRRMAALSMVSGSVPTATVKKEGTLTRMFSRESAPRSGTSICMGSRLR